MEHGIALRRFRWIVVILLPLQLNACRTAQPGSMNIDSGANPVVVFEHAARSQARGPGALAGSTLPSMDGEETEVGPRSPIVWSEVVPVEPEGLGSMGSVGFFIIIPVAIAVFAVFLFGG